MGLFDFNGDGKTSLTEGLVGGMLISNILDNDKEKSSQKETSIKVAPNNPKIVSDKEWNHVVGLCVRILLGTAALPVINWLLSVSSQLFDRLK